MYGYWTQCFYSCDPESYESYVKTGKKLPMTQFDKHGNPTSSIHAFSKSNNFSEANLSSGSKEPTDTDTIRNNTSKMNGHYVQPKFMLNESDGELSEVTDFTDLEKLEITDRVSANVNNNNNHDNNGGNNKQRKFNTIGNNSKKVADSKYTTMSVPSNLNSLIKDLVELWTISPRPPYASEVSRNFQQLQYNNTKMCSIRLFK